MITVLIPLNVEASTDVTANITTNTTWTTAGSPYIIKNDININTNVILTIQPGVTVKFESGVDIDVYGALVADGTPSLPITFTSTSSTPSWGSWDRIDFNSGCSNSSCVIDNCHFEYASFPIYTNYAGINITNSSIYYCSYGPHLHYSDCWLNNVTIDRISNTGLYKDRNSIHMNEVYINNTWESCDLRYGLNVVTNTAFNNSWRGLMLRYDAVDHLRNVSHYNMNDGCLFYDGTNKYLYADDLYFYDCDENVIYTTKGYIKNATLEDCYEGFRVYSSQPTFSFEDVHFKDTRWVDYRLIGSARPKIINHTSTGNDGNSSIYIDGVNVDPKIYDSTISAPLANSDIFMHTGTRLSLINSTFDPSNVKYYDSTPKIGVFDYFDLKVKNKTSTKVPFADYLVKNKDGQIIMGGEVDANGIDTDATYHDKNVGPLGTISMQPNTIEAFDGSGVNVEYGENKTTVSKSELVNVTIEKNLDLIIWNTDHVLTANEYYKDKRIIAKGNVNSTGFILGLENVNFSFQHMDDSSKGFIFDTSAKLNASNTTFLSIPNKLGAFSNYIWMMDRSTVDLFNCSVNNTYQNGIFSSDGVALFNASIFNTQTGYSIYTDSCNLWVENCTFVRTSSYPIYSRYDIMASVKNCTFARSNDAVYFYNSDKGVIENCTFYGQGTRCIRAYGCDSILIIKNITSTDYSYPVYLERSDFFIQDFFSNYAYEAIEFNFCDGIMQNIDIRNASYRCITLSSTVNLVMRNFTLYNSGNDGIYTSSGNSRIEMYDGLIYDTNDYAIETYGEVGMENVTVEDSRYGVRLYSSNNPCFISNCYFGNASNYGFYAQYKNYGELIIENSTFYQSVGSYLFQAYDSEPLLINSTIYNAGTVTWDVSADTNSIIYMLNTTYDLDNTYLSTNSQIMNMSFCHLITTDASHTAVPDSSFTIKDVFNNEITTGKTNNHGKKMWIPFVETICSYDNVESANPHTFEAWNYSGVKVYGGQTVTSPTQQAWIEVQLYYDPTTIYWAVDHVLTSNETYSNVRIIAAGNVTVPSPWFLAFETNVSLMMEHRTDGDKGIDIQDGGTFNCSNSSIRSIGSDSFGVQFEYYFTVGASTGATLILNGTEIRHTTEEGVYIEDSVFINVTNCTFDESYRGVYLVSSSGYFFNVTAYGEYGIHLNNAYDVTIEWSYFDTGSYGVYIQSSSFIYILNNTFQDSSYGIRMNNGNEQYVGYCFFNHTTNYGIYGSNADFFSLRNNFTSAGSYNLYNYRGFVGSYQDRFYDGSTAIYSYGFTGSNQAITVVHDVLIEDYSQVGYSDSSGSHLFFENATIDRCSGNAFYSWSGNTYVANSTITRTWGRNVENNYGTFYAFNSSFGETTWDENFYLQNTKGVITNCTLYGPANDHTIYSDDAEILFLNCTIQDTQVPGTRNTTYARDYSEISFINCTMSTNNIFCGINSEIRYGWFVHIYVVDNLGNPLSGMNVTTQDAYDVIWTNKKSDAYGAVYNAICIEKVFDGDGVNNSINPYNISANDMGFYEDKIITINTFQYIVITMTDSFDPITTIAMGTPRYRAQAGHIWNVSDATTFTLSATDFFSGVSATYYRIDGAAVWNLYLSQFDLSAHSEGLRKIEYYSTDASLNSESVKTIWVYLDKSLPNIGLTVNPPIYRAMAGDVWNVTSDTNFLVSGADNPGMSSLVYKIDNGPWIPASGWFDLSSESQGLHNITINGTNNLGMEAVKKIYWYRLDDLAPIASFEPVGPAHNDLAMDMLNITDSTDIRLNATDPGSGVKDIYYNMDLGGWTVYSGDIDLSLLGEGYHLLEFCAEDNLEHNSTVVSLHLWMDRTGPVSNLLFGDPKYKQNPPDMENITQDTQIEITAVDDHCGVNTSFYSIAGGPFIEYSGPFKLSSFSGQVNITFYSLDNVLNAEVSKVVWVFVDDIAPKVTLKFSEPKFQAEIGDILNITSSTNITMVMTDEGSGGLTQRYRVDGEFWIDYTGPFTLSGRDEGLHFLEYQGTDNLNNQGVVNGTWIYLDDSGPETTVTLEGLYYPATGIQRNITKNTSIVLSSIDTGSGVSKTYYSIDGDVWTEYIGSFNLEGKEPGIHTISFYSEDNLLNRETVREEKLYLVLKGPEVTITFEGLSIDTALGTLVGPSTMIKITARSQAGVEVVEYSLDGSALETFNNSIPLTELKHGKHLITAWATNLLGIQSAAVMKEFTFDGLAPATTASPDIEPLGFNFTEEPTFTLTAEDKDSSVKTTFYAIDGDQAFTTYVSPFKVTGAGDHYIRFYSSDVFGNLEAVKRYDFVILDQSESLLKVDDLEEYYTDPEIKVSGIATPSYLVAIHLNGNYLEQKLIEDGTFSFDIELEEGLNTVVLKLLDPTFKPIKDSDEYTTILDTKKPVITKTRPEMDEEEVVINSWVKIYFNEALNDDACTVIVSSGSGPVDGTLEYDAAGFILIFKPLDNLEKETEYTVTASAADKAGHVTDYDFSFTTSTEEGEQDPGDDDVVLVDSDLDGMPDEWEEKHNLDPMSPADAKLDPDEDGRDNLQEYRDGTDPNKSDVPPEPTDDDDDDSTGMGGVMLLGLVLLIIVIIIIIIIVVMVMRRRKKDEEEDEEDAKPSRSRTKDEKDEESVEEVVEARVYTPDLVEAEVETLDIFEEKKIQKATGGKKKARTVDISAPDPLPDSGLPGMDTSKISIDSWDIGPDMAMPDMGMDDEPAGEIAIDDPYGGFIPSSSKGPILALPPAQVFEASFEESDLPKIDELFLITVDGMLLRHFSYKDTTLVDEDILSGMLTVIQNFISDSFGTKTALKELNIGEFHIQITRGDTLSAVVISSEKDLKKLEKPVDAMVKDLEVQNKEVLKDWSGSTDALIGVDSSVNKLVSGGY